MPVEFDLFGGTRRTPCKGSGRMSPKPKRYKGSKAAKRASRRRR